MPFKEYYCIKLINEVKLTHNAENKQNSNNRIKDEISFEVNINIHKICT